MNQKQDLFAKNSSGYVILVKIYWIKRQCIFWDEGFRWNLKRHLFRRTLGFVEKR